ncbi:36627_t:CDS:1, partial [Gigaspora margarita]
LILKEFAPIDHNYNRRLCVPLNGNIIGTLIGSFFNANIAYNHYCIKDEKDE